jgi:hypothetical protein
LSTFVGVLKAGIRVRVGNAVTVFVIVVVGISVCVLPVIGTRNAKKESVGEAMDVGVKNIKAKACWVIAISGGLGVAVYLGSRISAWMSGVPP